MSVRHNIDLSPEQYETILALFDLYFPNTAVWAFGSRAKRNSHLKSDLDLVVFAKANQWMQVELLREEFEEGDLPFRVDLLIWNELPKALRENIEDEHVVLIDEIKPQVSGLKIGWKTRPK